MHKLDLNINSTPVYFIGIGGISMSGIAELFLDKGFKVSGSDLHESAVTKRLEQLGITVYYSQEAKNITPDIGLAIYTAAIHEDNPELVKAKELGIPMMERAECLGQIMSHYKNAVAVAGTHGKTTTTSMLSYVYLEADLDPTVSVGGILSGIHGNMRLGKSENFIMEACEYANSFLSFTPTTAVVLNVEAEHLDFFGTLENERLSFTKFIDLLPANGLLVINNEIEDSENLVKNTGIRVVTYGLKAFNAKEPDYTAKNIIYNDFGCACYELIVRGENKGLIELSVTGEHNVSNSLAVIAASLEPSEIYKAGISLDKIRQGIKKYTGTDRRFQYKGKRDGYTIVDDYAHHPTEIRATLEAAKRVKHNRLIIAFQPHLYSRTKTFLREFADVLSLADIVVFAEIYAAREENPGNISSDNIRKIMSENGHEAYFFKTFEEIENFLIHTCKPDDLLITMGAGDIVKVGENMLK
ncbi:MAG: UDP-N-acetylmuramate--L-alanine ligase [Catonella sp.]|uniref:UDP-N-acetylmuramate--L-alanine ligase n=1 Tax=Catonella sp. TaxID=2382125 RepID=UPI003F9F7EE1